MERSAMTAGYGAFPWFAVIAPEYRLHSGFCVVTHRGNSAVYRKGRNPVDTGGTLVDCTGCVIIEKILPPTPIEK